MPCFADFSADVPVLGLFFSFVLGSLGSSILWLAAAIATLGAPGGSSSIGVEVAPGSTGLQRLSEVLVFSFPYKRLSVTLRDQRLRFSPCGPFPAAKTRLFVGACLATGDRISADREQHCLKMCFAMLCLFLLDFRAYNHGVKRPQKPKTYCDKNFCDPIFRLRLYCLVCLVGNHVATGSCDPVSRRLPRQHVPTTIRLDAKISKTWSYLPWTAPKEALLRSEPELRQKNTEHEFCRLWRWGSGGVTQVYWFSFTHRSDITDFKAPDWPNIRDLARGLMWQTLPNFCLWHLSSPYQIVQAGSL